MNLYLESGYLDMKRILAHPAPFIFIVSARGTGKTYGMLQAIDKTECRTLFLRRIESQLKTIITDEGNPFKSINTDTGASYKIIKARGMTLGNLYDESNNVIFGYASALSIFKNIRGIDFSNIELIFYDEFIGEAHEKPIRGEGDAFYNLYESINRNRELKGREPLKVVCAANSNRLDNPLFMDLGLVDSALKLSKSDEETLYLQERGVLIIMPKRSPISERKAQTALYKLASGSKFEKMAIENAFSYDDFSLVGTRPLKEYKPLCVINDFTIMEHKADESLYIINRSYKDDKLPFFNTDSKDGLAAFKAAFGLWIWNAILAGSVTFQSYAIKSEVISLFKS